MPGSKTLSRDTHPDAEAVQIRVFASMSPAEKIEMMDAANRAALQLAEAGVRSRYPHASEAEVRRRLMDLTLGPELAARVYGPLPGADPGEAADAGA